MTWLARQIAIRTFFAFMGLGYLSAIRWFFNGTPGDLAFDFKPGWIPDGAVIAALTFAVYVLAVAMLASFAAVFVYQDPA